MRLSEKEIIQRLLSSAEAYKPLSLERIAQQPNFILGIRSDFAGQPPFEALVEIVSIATPKLITEKCKVLVDYVRKINRPDLIPMIVAPYIAGAQAQILAEEKVSWIDLSGNMTVQVPGQIYIERTGNKNKFPDTSPIKKIFEGTSSLVCRALLLKPGGFSSLYEIVDFINAKNANITLATVSRVLKSLEEELLITRGRPLISVIDSQKLLDKLTESYINYRKRREQVTYRFATDSPERFLLSLFSNRVDFLACGFYAAKLKGLAVTDRVTIFVKNIEGAREIGGIIPDEEFGNLDIIETKNPAVWFNGSCESPKSIVDDIELYLEMMADTPRGPKIAEVLKPQILKDTINERKNI